MSTTWHTPDPVQGAAIDALGGGTGLISMPNDDELVRAAIVRLPTEMLADWIAFLRDDGIRQRIEADGLLMSGPIQHLGVDAYVRRRFSSTIGSPITINGEDSDEFQIDRTAGNVVVTMRSTSPAPPGNVTCRIWTPQGSANTVTIQREGASTICTLPANVYASATLSYWDVENQWRLSGGFNLDLTAANP